MKRNLLFWIAILMLPAVMMSQSVDDDMYFVPGKQKSSKQTVTLNSASSSTSVNRTIQSTSAPVIVDDQDANADYHTGNLRDVDDYNRRGQVLTRLVNDTLYIMTDSLQEKSYVLDDPSSESYYDGGYYDDDYYYTSRLHRYHGYRFYDPFLWDYYYGWYDPWYDPWYGWYAPHFRLGYYSWFGWGWGWHHYPGWDLAWYHPGWYGHGGYYHYGRGRIQPVNHFNLGHRMSTNEGRYPTNTNPRGGRSGVSTIGTRSARDVSTSRTARTATSRSTTQPSTTVRSTREQSTNRTTVTSPSRSSRSTTPSRSVVTTPSTSSRSSSSSSMGVSRGGGGISSGGGFGGGGFGGGGRSGGGGGGRGGR